MLLRSEQREMKPESKGHIVADTDDTFDAWIKQHVMPTGSRSGNEMAMHCLWVQRTSKGTNRPVAIIAGDANSALDLGEG